MKKLSIPGAICYILVVFIVLQLIFLVINSDRKIDRLEQEISRLKSSAQYENLLQLHNENIELMDQNAKQSIELLRIYKMLQEQGIQIRGRE